MERNFTPAQLYTSRSEAQRIHRCEGRDEVMKRQIRYIATFAAGALFFKFGQMAFNTWTSRPGNAGGEILFIPLMALIFYMGWDSKGFIEEIKKELFS